MHRRCANEKAMQIIGVDALLSDATTASLDVGIACGRITTVRRLA
jgi:hypothetical protein